MRKNWPTEAGFYLVKLEQDHVYPELIVRIYDNSPYLRWKAWRFHNDEIIMDSNYIGNYLPSQWVFVEQLYMGIPCT
jgi:hypothetical protein